MRPEWPQESLGEICQFLNGLWKGQSPPFATVGVIRNTNFTKDCTLDHSDIIQLPVEKRQFEGRKLQYGDLIVEKSGGGPKQPVGRAVLYEGENGNLSFSNFTSVLRIIDTSKVDPQFLHRFLYWTYLSGTTEAMQSHSTGIRNLNMAAYKAIRVGLPPIDEQQRIVGILEKAFAAIAAAKANTEKNLQNASALFASKLQSVFANAWAAGPLVKLADLASDITDGDHLPPPKARDGVPFVTIGNINKASRRIDFSDTFMVPRSYFDALKANKKPRKGDVLYTVTGSFGIPVVVDNGTEFCFQRHIGLVRPKPEILSKWMYYLLLSPQVFRQAADGATGAAQRTVSLQLLRNFQVPAASRSQQESEVSSLDTIAREVERLGNNARSKLNALDELKQSVLQEAFAGVL